MSSVQSYCFWRFAFTTSAWFTLFINKHKTSCTNADLLFLLSCPRGRSRIWLREEAQIFLADFCRLHTAESCEWSEPLLAGVQARLRALEALGFFITKHAFSPFWGIFLYYFWNNKILIFLDKLFWQTFLYTGIQILDQMYMYLFLKNYFLFKYQSIMYKNHNAMFMINVHCIMYNLYEHMKIK